MSGKYHHGDLRSALVTTSLDLIAEQGMDAFSVAEVARRAKVSPGAPYRHFADRDSLLAAVACTAAKQLAEQVREATAAHGEPVEQLAAAAGAYTEYLIRRRAGLHVMFAPGLRGPHYAELHEQTRILMDEFLMRCLAVSTGPTEALDLMEQLLTQAHGYAAFQLDAVFAVHGYSVEQVVRKSVTAARIVILGHHGELGERG